VTLDAPKQTYFCESCQVIYDDNPNEGGDPSINDRYPDARAIARDNRAHRDRMRHKQWEREHGIGDRKDAR